MEVLFGEIDEGTGDIGVVGDEPTVEIGKAEEGAYILDFSGGRPFGNSVEFDGVHGELSWFNNHSEIFYLVGGKLAFFEFKM